MVSCVPAPRRVMAFITWPRAWCCFLIALGVLSAGPVTAQTAVQQPPPSAPASAAELREELQRLRQEFESIRDAYGARLAALESRLGQQAGAAATPAVAGQAPAAMPAPVPPLPAEPAPVVVQAQPPPGQAQPPEVAVPADVLAAANGRITLTSDRGFVAGEKEGTADRRRLAIRVYSVMVEGK